MESYSVIILVKGIKQDFPVVLFIMLFNMVLTFEFLDESLNSNTEMKATEQYFPVVL